MVRKLNGVATLNGKDKDHGGAALPSSPSWDGSEKGMPSVGPMSRGSRNARRRSGVERAPGCLPIIDKLPGAGAEGIQPLARRVYSSADHLLSAQILVNGLACSKEVGHGDFLYASGASSGPPAEESVYTPDKDDSDRPFPEISPE